MGKHWKRGICLLLAVFCTGMFGCRSPQKESSGALSAESTTAGEGIPESSASGNAVSGSAAQSGLPSETTITGEATGERTTYKGTTSNAATNGGAFAKTTTSGARRPQARPPLLNILRRVQKATLSGTFIQSWLCASWSDERWGQELSMLKELGMRYIILGDSATRNTNGNGFSGIPEIQSFNAQYNGVDVIKNALRNCQKYGMKAFVGVGMDERWWNNFCSAAPMAEFVYQTERPDC